MKRKAGREAYGIIICAGSGNVCRDFDKKLTFSFAILRYSNKKSYVILSSDSKMPLGFLRGNMRRYGRIHYKYREKEVGILRNEAI